MPHIYTSPPYTVTYLAHWVTANTIERLRVYNDWRTGKDERTMDEAGIVPKQITIDIKTVCDELEKLISMYASRN